MIIISNLNNVEGYLKEHGCVNLGAQLRKTLKQDVATQKRSNRNITHFIGSLWALASSLCWGGAMEESQL